MVVDPYHRYSNEAGRANKYIYDYFKLKNQLPCFSVAQWATEDSQAQAYSCVNTLYTQIALFFHGGGG